VIVLVHGIGEHIRRYDDWAARFRKENFAFAGFDLPGHGKSDGKRGKIKNYDILYESVDHILNTARRTFPGIPVFLYGHSLGGGIVLDYMLRKKPSVRGAVITSPWLKLAFEPSKLKAIMAMTVRSVLPGLVQPSGLETIYLSHNQSVVDAYKSDPLNHDRISVGLFTGAMISARYSLDHAGELGIPTLIVHGSDDMICSPEGSRQFCSNSPKCELRIFEGGYHELHNEAFNDEVFNHIMGWIRKQLTIKKQDAVQN
jgi:alpha-beta hydrolase superfamily lysophospholipase